MSCARRAGRPLHTTTDLRDIAHRAAGRHPGFDNNVGQDDTARADRAGLVTEDEMNTRMRTYTTYSIGVGIVWAIVLVLASLLDPSGKRKDIFLVFFGFAIGWVSATIARYVYPPPKKYRQDVGKAPESLG